MLPAKRVDLDEKNDAIPEPQEGLTAFCSGVAGGGAEVEGRGTEFDRGETDAELIKLKGRMPFTVAGLAGVSAARGTSCDTRGEEDVDDVGASVWAFCSSVLGLRCNHRPLTPSTALKKFVEPAVKVRLMASRVGASC